MFLNHQFLFKSYGFSIKSPIPSRKVSEDRIAYHLASIQSAFAPFRILLIELHSQRKAGKIILLMWFAPAVLAKTKA